MRENEKPCPGSATEHHDGLIIHACWGQKSGSFGGTSVPSELNGKLEPWIFVVVVAF